MAREDDFTSTVEGAAGWAYAHGRGGDYGDAPTRGEAEADEAYLRGDVRRVEPEARGVRCGSCKERHATPGDVRDCYAAARSAEDDAHAEMIAEQQAERAYAEDRERKAESGTWFGPQTEADSWGEDDDVLDRATRERLAHEATEARARDERRKADSDWSWDYQNRWGRAENE